MYAQSHPTLCNPMDCSPPGSLSMGFSKEEHCSGLSSAVPGDLTDPGIEPKSLASPTLTGGFCIIVPHGKPRINIGKALNTVPDTW